MDTVELDTVEAVPRVSGRRRSQWLYASLLLLVTCLFGVSLAVVRVRGGFVFPPWFVFFQVLYYVQFGFFGGAALSFLFYLFSRFRIPGFLKAAILVGFFYLTGWLFAWGMTQFAYGIELTHETLIELFTSPVAYRQMGLGPMEFGLIATAAAVFIAGLTVVSLISSSLINRRAAGRGFAICLALFLAVHIPVRAYFVHYANRANYAVLVYDDCAPLPLRSEQLIPHARAHRFALPNFEDDERVERYFDFMDAMRMPAVPRPRNILWMTIESFRFDAINERAMPRLYSWRDQFQVRLDRNHWSGGNATQFGMFSMLTGLSGSQFGEAVEAKRASPFLELLAENNYRIRAGSHFYMKYGGLHRLLPPSTVFGKFTVPKERDQRDRNMVELYLQDRQNRNNQQPAFDLLTFDATHWPYYYTEQQRRFQPDPLVISSLHVLRTETDLTAIRNRYDNACGSVDEQIELVLQDLKARGDFDNTIIIIAGDHGEEFQERGQLTHSSGLNDFQGRTSLWIHLPGELVPAQPIDINRPTVHIDIVPTVLEVLGFSEDVLYTQGRSLLSDTERRPALALCEQGFKVPLYRALVTDTYISRWLRTERHYLFSGVQRRDGEKVRGRAWLREAREATPAAAAMYEVTPDISKPPRRFQTH